MRLNAVDITVSPFGQGGNRRVVQQNCTLVSGSLRQIN